MASRRVRLDSELVRRGLARSREQAVDAISAGRVLVGGIPATKAATVVDGSTSIALAAGDDPGWASRGAHKLLGAFAAFGVPPLPGATEPDGDTAEPTAEPEERGQVRLSVAGRRCLDVGASTGGFTDVLLRHGAASVVAVDVGYGQLLWRLRSDPRVRVLDRVNARALTPEEVGDPAELVVGDLSFISLALVLPALRACAAPDADFVLLVKPQFEVGRERLGAGGVVRDPALHAQTVRDVAASAAVLGLGTRGVTASPLPGPAGNVEYLLWLAAGAPPLDEAALARAIEDGPAGSRDGAGAAAAPGHRAGRSR
ncbi:16S/23S rRNA (cytidine-2'-O)-methyltransferase TlyA [Frankia canadensis]|uniref:16S/23S rRNA (Cytidine-2'-O)-methyltransferase TlyA n=1 Tax=Frankia canadensis TaxID=1836972 RepID=A0A2I2KTA8_9ACTN|nr:TlyA family RNA methyltransferase [Frankia canadensis]SNQ48895.1 16S/23S rRNA (cytidine-2'-O)-methyltransferase TlyA [Frankia canadensis]SOU56185.1 16S/23S rRNA (cytidine-2'-O)-methyltransferase TlyA [Frankia canadensis]